MQRQPTAPTASPSPCKISLTRSRFGIGFYGGFIQIGAGFLFMAVFYHLLKINLVFVNMHKVVVSLL